MSAVIPQPVIPQPATPKPAATLVLVSNCDPNPRVLMGIRAMTMAFMPGKAVFPGGRVEADEGALDSQSPLALAVNAPTSSFCVTPEVAAAAALRELTEETGLRYQDLGPTGPLTCFGRAITPAFSPKRYDTLFFLGAISAPIPPTLGDAELERIAWYTATEIDLLPTMGITQRALAAAFHCLENRDTAEFSELTRL